MNFIDTHQLVNVTVLVKFITWLAEQSRESGGKFFLKPAILIQSIFI